MRTRLLLSLAALSLVGIALGMWIAPVRVGAKTALLLIDLFPGSPVRPILLLTPAPLVEEVRIPLGEGEIRAHLYRPRRPGRYGAVVALFGVTPVGLDDPRLVRLADGLARTGYVVLLPDSENLRANRVVPEEVDAVVAAFQYLRAQEFVDPDRVGMAGFCIGASLVALAAERPAINDEVAFVSFFGGYYELRDLVAAVATRRVTYRGRSWEWEPRKLTVELTVNHLADTLPLARDRELLRGMLRQGVFAPDPAAAAGLSPAGRRVYAVLANTDPERVPELLDALPAATQDVLRALSPSEGISRLRAKTFVMADVDDVNLPSTESRKFADAVPGEKHVTIFRLFDHMDVRPTRDLPTLAREMARLFWHLHLILRQM